MNKNLLISFDNYQEKPPVRVPYTYIISNDTQYLYYFGSRHSYDPKDPEFIELKSFFNEFSEKTKDRNRIVLVEGGNWPIIEDEERSIIECSEMGFVAHLAAKLNIERISPEPPDKLLFSELSKQYSRDEVAYHYFARSCWQWERMIEKKSFEAYINSVLEAYKYTSGWSDYDFSLVHMKEVHKTLFGKEFDMSDKFFFRDIIDPTKDHTVVNKISRFEDEGFRDGHIVNEIEKYWKKGKSIFVIYGSSHAEIQEPALRTLS
jgi:hypothetical protein